ncbi:MAG: DUF1028 domain-containing protein [Bacteroidota bacterium]
MKIIYVILLAAVFPFRASAQDTFSICAYDSITGQVGSAGATCIQGTTSAVIISDVLPGLGVIHTQASWLQANKTYAHSLMLLGLTPQQIIDSVTLHDAQGDPTIRQYGIIDVTGASAGYTGSACLNYHNHINGPGYAIQGNILLGQQILDSMESRFLNTPGDLACRLMSALQGAKVPGADTRCAPLGISAVSAFIRVANPSDTVGGTPFYLNMSINTFPNYQEPIDSLQERFYLWGGCGAASVSTLLERSGIIAYPNPVESKLTIGNRYLAIKTIEIVNLLGIPENLKFENPFESTSETAIEIDVTSFQAGIYFLRIETTSGEIISMKIVKM